MKSRHPEIFIDDLDNLWFQVGGTLCNLVCEHCFISCGPKNHSFEFMTLDQVTRYIEESLELGVKEYYFTGGEPFMNPQILDILENALQYGPSTVLTNGTLFKEAMVERMAKMEGASIYSLEIRISLEGYGEEMNDAIRGKGVFEKVIQGLNLLVQHEFIPIITITKTWQDNEDGEVMEGFNNMLKSYGYQRPRVKILPSIKIGRETMRDRDYEEYEMVTNEMMEGFDPSLLLCSNTRMATSKGTYVCPLLIKEDQAYMGKSLKESMRGFELKYHACYTCYLHGAICSNISFVGEHG